MAKETTKYELMVIFKPLLPDDVRKKSHKAIVDLADALGGKVTNADVWGKRYLAYKVKGHEEGYYIVYEMSLPSSGLKNLETGLRRVAEILRFFITRVEESAAPSVRLNKKVMEI